MYSIFPKDFRIENLLLKNSLAWTLNRSASDTSILISGTGTTFSAATSDISNENTAVVGPFCALSIDLRIGGLGMVGWNCDVIACGIQRIRKTTSRSRDKTATNGWQVNVKCVYLKYYIKTKLKLGKTTLAGIWQLLYDLVFNPWAIQRNQTNKEGSSWVRRRTSTDNTVEEITNEQSNVKDEDIFFAMKLPLCCVLQGRGRAGQSSFLTKGGEELVWLLCFTLPFWFWVFASESIVLFALICGVLYGYVVMFKIYLRAPLYTRK